MPSGWAFVYRAQYPVGLPLVEEAFGVGCCVVWAAIEVEGLADPASETASGCRGSNVASLGVRCIVLGRR